VAETTKQLDKKTLEAPGELICGGMFCGNLFLPIKEGEDIADLYRRL